MEVRFEAAWFVRVEECALEGGYGWVGRGNDGRYRGKRGGEKRVRVEDGGVEGPVVVRLTNVLLHHQNCRKYH